jgi:hypothetical protein
MNYREYSEVQKRRGRTIYIVSAKLPHSAPVRLKDCVLPVSLGEASPATADTEMSRWSSVTATGVIKLPIRMTEPLAAQPTAVRRRTRKAVAAQ